ncbi:MAG: GNAT family N-acetyltransferase [Actinomycetota bacterium]|nr:GNAT family N-acetyltransferase [Actinomycetota bacterium]
MTEINRDPDVLRFLNNQPGLATWYERVLAHWEQHGFGFFAVEGREADLRGELIGFVGIAYPAFLPELAARPELGWRLASRAWGRGLATEAARAVRAGAFADLDLPELISIIHPQNLRSQRVATKLGMTIERQVENPNLGQLVDLWQLDAPRARASDQPDSSGASVNPAAFSALQ